MNKPRYPSEEEADFKIFIYFNLTEKVIDNIIVELEKIKLFIHIYYGRKINQHKGCMSMEIRIFFQYNFSFNRDDLYADRTSLVPLLMLYD